MRFSIDSKKFKALTAAILMLCKKEDCVLFEAAGRTLAVTGRNERNILNVAADCEVAETGRAIVTYAELKAAVAGEKSEFVFEREPNREDNKLFKLPSDEKLSLVMTCNCKDFIKTLGDLKDFRRETNDKAIYTGYHMDCRKGRVEALNGYIGGFETLDAEYESDESYNIQGCVYELLKKLVPMKDAKDMTLVIERGKLGTVEFLRISGGGFSLYSNLTNGEFADLDKIIYTKDVEWYTIAMDMDHFASVCKAYASGIGSYNAQNAGAILYVGENGIGTTIDCGSFSSDDLFPSAKIVAQDRSDTFITSFNSKYGEVIGGFMSKDEAYTHLYAPTSVMIFTSEHYDRAALMMPVRLFRTEQEYMKNYKRLTNT